MALKSSQKAETDPVEIQRIQEHLGQHMAMFQEQDGKAAQALAQEVAELSNALNQPTQDNMAPQPNGSQNIQPGMDTGGGETPGTISQQPVGAEN